MGIFKLYTTGSEKKTSDFVYQYGTRQQCNAVLCKNRFLRHLQLQNRCIYVRKVLYFVSGTRDQFFHFFLQCIDRTSLQSNVLNGLFHQFECGHMPVVWLERATIGDPLMVSKILFFAPLIFSS